MLSFSFLWLKTTSCESTLEEGKNLNSLALLVLFLHVKTTKLSLFPSLFFSFTTLKSSVSTDDDDCVYCEFFCEFFFLHFFNEQE